LTLFSTRAEQAQSQGERINREFDEGRLFLNVAKAADTGTS